MATKRKGTVAKAQTKLLNALRDFQVAVADMVGTDAGASRGKKKAAKKRKRNAGRRGR